MGGADRKGAGMASHRPICSLDIEIVLRTGPLSIRADRFAAIFGEQLNYLIFSIITNI